MTAGKSFSHSSKSNLSQDYRSAKTVLCFCICIIETNLYCTVNNQMRFVDKYKDIFYLLIYNLYRQQKYAHQQHNYKTTKEAVAKNV